MKSRGIDCTDKTSLFVVVVSFKAARTKRLFCFLNLGLDLDKQPHSGDKKVERRNKMKKKLIIAIAMMLTLSLVFMTACSKKETAEEPKEEEKVEEAAEEEAAEEEATEEEATEEEAAEEEEEDYTTGDASLDNPRNGDEIGEAEMLVSSFGTSFNDNRRLTIGAIESDLEKAFPDYAVRRGFTAQIVIDHIMRRDNVAIDNMTQALDRAEANGVKTLVVVPTHLMSGFEYNDVVDEIAGKSDAFEKVVISKPLLDSDADFDAVAKAIYEDTKSYDDGETAICFMGHGTEADSNAVYGKMQETLKGLGYNNIFIGTVEAAPTIDDVIGMVKDGGYKKVVLQPLMVVAGDHANNDMAGDEEDSWKSIMEKEGFEVTCVLKGLGEIQAVRDIYVAHAQDAVNTL